MKFLAKLKAYNLCIKGARIRSFSGPYFPALGLNTEIYRVTDLHVQSYQYSNLGSNILHQAEVAAHQN